MRDSRVAHRTPELAVLSALAHGNGPGGVEAVYHDLVLARPNEAARRALEEHMKIGSVEWEPQSDFARKHFARGKAEGKAESVLAILAARGIAVTETARQRIAGCADIETLDRYLARAAVAASAEEVVADA